ncbi:hypothetical protein GALMADRAFT_281953 [Galerina marginata CBS 339.88]|uniref:Glycosyl hydrolase family 92 domain-containing protein n=1 Tax=Galerina marginata (strain CBS 339.88) TaxID=685588 RepID=A0A067SM10_GALM3|nr:hypothetical protein GALMADRAFT_281953 [Galerina marginata CBS 339.88]
MKTRRNLFLCLFCALICLSDATSTHPPPAFAIPPSPGLDLVNLLIGNGGDTPNGSGGNIPSTAPPFGMTRWVAQTQTHYVSATPYNWTLDKVMGVVGTRQPAIWMGESAPISVSAGVGRNVVVDFDQRGLEVLRGTDGQKKEVVSSGYYNVELDDGHGGSIIIEQTATSRVAHLRFTFKSTLSPYILFEVARPSVITSTASNITFPSGSVSILDDLEHFKGYFCARFNEGSPKPTYGVIQNGTKSSLSPQDKAVQGSLLSAYARFPTSASATEPTVITLRVGTSFISEEQARKNIDVEIPDSPPSPSAFLTESSPTADGHLVPGTFENTAYRVRKSWADILNRIDLKLYLNDSAATASPRDFVDQQTFWTAIVHTLQFPTEQHERNRYYSGYDNQVHELEEGGESYTGYSIWDTFRAEWAWQILFVPERIPGLVQSMLADYKEGGWLPIWKNVVETNIMVGKHADSLIAEAVLKNVTGFDRELAWEAVWKDATVPPKDDLTGFDLHTVIMLNDVGLDEYITYSLKYPRAKYTTRSVSSSPHSHLYSVPLCSLDDGITITLLGGE